MKNCNFSPRVILKPRRLVASGVTVACMLFAGSAFGFTNFLTNPGFEAGPTGGFVAIPGWVGYYNFAVESTNNLIYNSQKHVEVHGGTNSFKTWGGYQGGDTFCGCYQDKPAAPDSVWSAEGWGFTHLDDKMAGANQCWLEVSFRNGNSPNAALITYVSSPLTSSTPGSTWTRLIVLDGGGSTNLVAPAGTTFVRCQIVYKQVGGTYAAGSAYLDDVFLTKTSAPDPEISVQPQSQTKVVSQAVTFSITAGGKSSLSYQWKKDGSDMSDSARITGSRTASLTINDLSTADQGSYSVTVTDNAGSLDSEPATLTVLDPGIITQPVSQTKMTGESVSFTVTGAGATALTYQWQKDGSDLSNGPRISGAASATLSIANLQTSDQGSYTVIITDQAGSVTSDPALLQVQTPADVANRLKNSSFEAGTASWSRFNGDAIENTNMVVSGSSTPVPARTGANVNKAFSGGTWNGIFQDVSVTPGEIFAADIWFRTEAEDRIAGGNECWLEVQFLNAGDGMLGLYKSVSVDANSPASTWINLAATNIIAFWGDYSVAGNATYLVAPPNTAKARFQVTYHGVGGTGSVYADDARLMLKTPVTVSGSVSAGKFHLSFLTQGGTRYQVLYKDVLTDPGWQVLTTVEGDGSVKTVDDTLGGGRFYMVNTL
jgi:hypothetical protein